MPVVFGRKPHQPLPFFVYNLEIDSLLQDPFKHVKFVRLYGIVEGCLVEKINLVMVSSELIKQLAGT